MNGRLYDPLLRRFLNADENIQDMFNTQNYNKYGYVLNNPLMFNDPSGEFFIFGFLAGMASKFLAGIITAAIIGAGAGLVTYSLSVLFTGAQWKLGGALKSMFFGAVGGAASFGVGSIFTNAAGSATTIAGALGKFGSAVVQGGAHAISQGVLSLFQGGSFVSGALGGALGSWAASGFGAVAGEWAGKAGGQIFFGALAGGVGAELSGGNFWQGAITGGIVAGLNHAMHEIGNKSDDLQSLLDNQPPGTEIRFDGKFLRIYRDGKEVFRMKAVSGRAQDDGSFDYSNSNQQNKGKGPIPEGSYSIDPSKVQSFQDQSITSFLKGFVGGGSFPGGTYSWGNERVWINVEGNTNVYGRSGFTIHGGAVYGSAGCIDLGPNSSIFFKALMKLNLEGIRNVPLNVKYK